MSTPIGSFRVRAEPAEVEAFRQATRLESGGDGLPLTFPIRWLVTPEIRAALVAMVPEPDLVLFHESQSFAYEQPLRPDETYNLTLSARRETAPDRLLVDGTIDDASGARCATVETILRLFSTKAVAA